MQDLPSEVIEAKAEDLARTFAGALNHKDKLVSGDQRDQSKVGGPLLKS